MSDISFWMRWCARFTDRFERCRNCVLLALCSSTALAVAAQTAEPTARDLHTFACVAALEVKANDLAGQIKAGQKDLQPLLLTTLNAGAAFIGHAYLQGDRDEERAQNLKDAALQAHKLLPANELAALQSGCAQEGGKLLAEADFIGRFVVTRLAQRQMKKLIGDLAP